MKKKNIAIFLSILLLIALISSITYAIDYANTFLKYPYSVRASKCKYLISWNINTLLKENQLPQDTIINLGEGINQFQAIDLLGETNQYIILIHGKRECPYAMLKGGLKLREQGFSVLIPVLFSHGNDSLNDLTDYGKYSIGQIDSCVNYLLRKGVNDIGISGRSMGASIAIIAAAKNKNIKAVAAECPLLSVESSIEYKHKLYSKLPSFPFVKMKTWSVEKLLNYPLDSLATKYFISRISPRPIFIMAATEDQVINPKDFDELYKLAGDPKYLWKEPIDHTKFHSQLKVEFYIRIPAFFKKSFRQE